MLFILLYKSKFCAVILNCLSINGGCNFKNRVINNNNKKNMIMYLIIDKT